jgi:sec-independent protein translocase protein TatA
MFNGIGGAEVLLVILVVLVLFGSKRIPDLARTLGKATYELRKAMNQVKDELETSTHVEEPPKGPDKNRPG